MLAATVHSGKVQRHVASGGPDPPEGVVAAVISSFSRGRLGGRAAMLVVAPLVLLVALTGCSGKHSASAGSQASTNGTSSSGGASTGIDDSASASAPTTSASLSHAPSSTAATRGRTTAPVSRSAGPSTAPISIPPNLCSGTD